jgi:hypothetical protein
LFNQVSFFQVSLVLIDITIFFYILNKSGHRNVLSKRQVWMSIFHIINFGYTQVCMMSSRNCFSYVLVRVNGDFVCIFCLFFFLALYYYYYFFFYAWYCLMWYRVHFAWVGFELTTLGTASIGSCKSNYHKIMITMTPTLGL